MGKDSAQNLLSSSICTSGIARGGGLISFGGIITPSEPFQVGGSKAETYGAISLSLSKPDLGSLKIRTGKA